MTVLESLSQGTIDRALALRLDAEDPLRHFRNEFLIPSKSDISRTTLPSLATADAGVGSGPAAGGDDAGAAVAGATAAASASASASATSASDSTATATVDEAVYLVGNSLGLQPRRTETRIQQYLATWRTQGVQGHFKRLDGSPLPTWLDVDARAAEMMGPIVGAHAEEVAVMQTLTANLHFLMAAFYTPDPKSRHKIILERKAFPSDHFVVESQICHHGLRPEDSMVLLDPTDGNEILSTEYIESVIDEHASTTAVLLLPGIQYYTGQLLDIPRITAFARARGIFVIWDLAHAVGNVPLDLHNWNVDAAAWCTYKYLNGGPGCIGGLFVHQRNAPVGAAGEHPTRLAGWWGNNKAERFGMTPGFRPVAGAAGFQVSNPSVLDSTSLCASLEIFHMAGGVSPLRERSRWLTAFLVVTLDQRMGEGTPLAGSWRILTPREPERRGAQISLLLEDGLLDDVMAGLEKRSVLVDERRPDVIRVAPAPLYNTFKDCWDFVSAFEEALGAAIKAKSGGK